MGDRQADGSGRLREALGDPRSTWRRASRLRRSSCSRSKGRRRSTGSTATHRRRRSIADGRVVCHFGAMGTACVDATTGDVLWKRQFEIDHIVGPGSSPVVHKGLVILTCDGGDKQFIVALDAKTGDTVWQVDRPPIRIEIPICGRRTARRWCSRPAGAIRWSIPGAQWFVAYDPTTGDEIWRVDHGERLLERAAAGLRRREGVSRHRVQQGPALGRARRRHRRRERNARRVAAQAADADDAVARDGRRSDLRDQRRRRGDVPRRGDRRTVVWRERVGGQFSASPLLGAGRVYFCSHEGRTTVVAAADKFEVLAENELDGQLMASPGGAEGDLILRTDTHLYRIAAE